MLRIFRMALPLLALLLLLGAVPAATAMGGGHAIAATSAKPVTGSVQGAAYLGTGAHSVYVVNGSGGPAEAANGTIVGQYNFTVSFAGANTTGLSASPPSGVLVNGTLNFTFFTGNVSETVTILVEINSVYHGQNASINVSATVQIVQPYVLTATIVAGSGASTLGFPLVIYLDGNPVGTVAVPSLTAGTSYKVSFDYVTLGLSPGWHTFTASLAQEHGLLTFTGGATSFSQSIYIPGPAPDYTLWYVAGIVAFFAAVFILLTRLAARRRGRATPK
jgi:hypothetical protein